MDNSCNTLGDIGQGPGEMEYPILVSIINDLVFLGDRSSRENFEVFSTDGKYLEKMEYKEVKNDLISEKRYSSILYLGDDKFLFEENQYETRKDGFLVRELGYGFADRAGTILKDLDISLEPFITGIITENGGMGRPMNFERCPVVLHDNLYILSRNGKDIYIFSRDGDLLKVFRLNTVEQLVGQEDMDHINKRHENSSNPAMFLSLLNLVGFPDNKPAVCDIVVDDNNLIWLRRRDTYRPYGSTFIDKKFTYIILDQDGEYLSDQVLPVKLSTVKDGHAYGFLKTEDGFSVFKKYQLNLY